MHKVYFREIFQGKKRLALVEVDTSDHKEAIAIVAEEYKLKTPALVLIENKNETSTPPEAA